MTSTIDIKDYISCWIQNYPPPSNDPFRYNTGINIPVRVTNEPEPLIVRGCVYWNNYLNSYVFEPVQITDTTIPTKTTILEDKEYRCLKEELKKRGVRYTLGVYREPQLQILST